MTAKIEARAYGSDCSDQERQAIADRVSKIEDNILLWKELPVPSLYSVDLMEQRVQELSKELGGYARVVDLSEAARPSAEVRRRLRQMLAREERLKHLAAFTKKNALITIALRFVFSGMVKSATTSVHQGHSGALEACRRAMGATQ